MCEFFTNTPTHAAVRISILGSTKRCTGTTWVRTYPREWVQYSPREWVQYSKRLTKAPVTAV